MVWAGNPLRAGGWRSTGGPHAALLFVIDGSVKGCLPRHDPVLSLSRAVAGCG